MTIFFHFCFILHNLNNCSIPTAWQPFLLENIRQTKGGVTKMRPEHCYEICQKELGLANLENEWSSDESC